MTTAKEIYDAFYAAEEEFGEDTSTEFLASIAGDRLGIDYDEVIDGLVEHSRELGEVEE